jgi:DNA repair photolyase
MFAETTVAKAITYEDSPDGGHLNIVDPYDGCTIACPYCFQRSDPSWSHPVIVKTNLPALLKQEIPSLHDPVYLGSRCDPYMPIERRFKLTRQCLELLSEMHVSTYLCTKAGPAVLARDYSLMESFHGDFTVVLGLANLSQIERAGDSSKTENISLANELHRRHIKVWAFISPVLPGITDVHAIMRELPKEMPVWLFDLQQPIHKAVGRSVLAYVARRHPELINDYQMIIRGYPDPYYQSLRAEYSHDQRVKFPYN